MSGIRVNFEALSTASGDISTGASGIGTTLSDLHTSLAPLRADWDGAARDAYDVAQRGWNGALEEMNALLAQIGRSVESSNAGYQNTEDLGRRAWE